MAAKVIWYREAWWVRSRFNGRKKEKRFGPAQSDKRRANDAMRQINARIELEKFGIFQPEQDPLPCTEQMNRWLETYRPTLKSTTAVSFNGLVRNHLGPHFGSRDLREIKEADLLRFVSLLQTKGLAPATIKNILSFLRIVYNSLIREERLTKNPAAHLGRIMRSVQNASAKETMIRQAWSHEEAATLLETCREHEPKFAPLLELLFATGLRRGEALGLQWADIDFDSQKMTIRRSITSQGLSTPKSGKSRRVVITPALSETLFALLSQRQRERIERGWPETPEWVFCSRDGTRPEPRNVERVWARLRRRAQKNGVRPFPLHSTRHSWATWALQAGKNIRWVADQLGHADASTTLNHYAHAMPEDDHDLSFLDLGVAGRRYPSPPSIDKDSESRKYAESWRARYDSNVRPSAPQADALSN